MFKYLNEVLQMMKLFRINQLNHWGSYYFSEEHLSCLLRTVKTFWSQIQQIFTTHIELFALPLKWGVNPDSVKNKRARNNDFLYAWATPLKEVCSQEVPNGVLSFEAEWER